MKISVNDQELFTISEIKKLVICNDIPSDMVEEDCMRRLEQCVMHKYTQCMKRLRQEWLPKLAANGVTSVPLDNDEFAQLVFAQPNYMDRAARDAAALAAANHVVEE